MTALTPEEMEGRLNAHRELMIDFIAALLSGEDRVQDFTRRLVEDASFKDHQEDPGALPDLGLATEASAADEVRSILEAARARAEATQEQS
ncbi:hypothetical protein [Rhizobium sp. CSW-27]|uniref:hypothetical protein n=1 Tax=Rhizobium sp. CSW-27 TaxID=2839985 RepID=UPI001C0277BF|nr:hypothetical protein [Rhizobium sp. CSW-27]MBT9369107.1 hypothetical protein [Rhizobium sp. CSW-27]